MPAVTDADAVVEVVVAICTYRRPQGLERLLRTIADQVLPSGCRVQVVVVDNDPAGSAEPVVHRFCELAHPCSYAQDARPGVSYCRNTAVRLAREAGADWIAFIDDDEWPEPEWLASLVTTALDTGADVVTGPVRPVYDADVPQWVRKGRFHQRSSHTDRAQLHFARTSNVLVRASVLPDEPFDPRFGVTGGEDTHLFERLVADGRKIIWDAHGIVAEEVPEERARLGWLLRREFRRGTTLARARRDVLPTAARGARTAAGGAARLAAGLLLVPFALFRGRIGAVRALRLAVYGAGLLLGRSRHAQFAEYDNRSGVGTGTSPPTRATPAPDPYLVAADAAAGSQPAATLEGAWDPSAYRYSMVSLAARVGLQAVSGILIARALGPSVFGLSILLISAYTVVSSVVLQGANGPLLIRSSIPAGFLRRTWFINGALGALGALGFLVVAAVWSGGRTDARVALVAAAAGCLVQSVAGSAMALNARHLRFDRIARGEVTGAVLGTSAGTAIAYSTGSALALPVQALVIDAVILAWLIPALREPRRLLPAIEGPEPGRRYAAQTNMTQLVSISSRNADNYLVAALLGQAAVGFYVLAYRLMMVPIQNVAMVLTRVLVPTLRRLANDAPRSGAEVRRLLLAIAAVTGPATGALLPLLEPLFDMVFGSDWSGAVRPTAILLLAAFPQCVINVCASVLAAAGHSREQLALTTASLGAALLAVVIGAPGGVDGVTTAYVVLTLVMLAGSVLVTYRTAGLAPASVRDALAFFLLSAASAAATALVGRALLPDGVSALVVLVVAAAAGLAVARLLAATWFAAAWAFWRDMVIGRSAVEAGGVRGRSR